MLDGDIKRIRKQFLKTLIFFDSLKKRLRYRDSRAKAHPWSHGVYRARSTEPRPPSFVSISSKTSKTTSKTARRRAEVTNWGVSTRCDLRLPPWKQSFSRVLCFLHFLAFLAPSASRNCWNFEVGTRLGALLSGFWSSGRAIGRSRHWVVGSGPRAVSARQLPGNFSRFSGVGPSKRQKWLCCARCEKSR